MLASSAARVRSKDIEGAENAPRRGPASREPERFDREVIQHEENGLLAEFFDVEGFTLQALRVLKDPSVYRTLGVQGRALVAERYSIEVTLPKLWDLCTRTMV